MDDIGITRTEVKAGIERGRKLFLVDVREPWEFEICRIEGAKLISLGALPANVNILLDADEVICYCHHGMRSRMRPRGCDSRGVVKVKSRPGGIERRSVEIDAKVPGY